MARVLLSCALLAPVALAAAELSRSPFQPRATAQAAAAQPDPTLDKLQFCGVVTIGDETLVGVLNQETQKTAWLAVGGSADGFRLSAYDPAASRIEVAAQGRTRSIQLREATFAAGPAAAAIPQVVPGVQFNPAGAQQRPAAAPVARVAGAPNQPMTVEQREAENARQMVSDLLELQLKHRRLNEETQRARLSQLGVENARASRKPGQ